MCVCAWVSGRGRQSVVREFAPIVHAHMSVGAPCMEMGVCQEYCRTECDG